MPMRCNGPLAADYKRALQAAKWAGWKVVRVEIGNSAITLIENETYLEKMATGQPEPPKREGVKLNW